ncbi:hypothetical protein M422DRAFT_256987 [Sphaerobolus stellatus SS14]|uniref:Uncharacterized protein n=1 Tax=Sphaerobolus stellatus (strain SS14) TaxID=990650 RepID=A0A0C9VFC8_SPHS4|nr:hypothetical protein M422DRAFT_256987 [Sphaerobolus stellatus SS14]
MPRNPNGPPRLQLSSIQYWMMEALSRKASMWLIGRSHESDNTKLSIGSNGGYAKPDSPSDDTAGRANVIPDTHTTVLLLRMRRGRGDGRWDVAEGRCDDVTRTQPRATPSRTAAVESDATDAISPIHAASSMISTVPCSIIVVEAAYSLGRTYQFDSLAIRVRTRMCERRFS